MSYHINMFIEKLSPADAIVKWVTEYNLFVLLNFYDIITELISYSLWTMTGTNKIMCV